MEPITPSTPVRDILNGHPSAVAILERYGLECAGCVGSEYETLRDICLVHNIELDQLVDELNSGRYGEPND